MDSYKVHPKLQINDVWVHLQDPRQFVQMCGKEAISLYVDANSVFDIIGRHAIH